jgi:hypothetical protein
MLIFRFIVRYVDSELRSRMVTQEPLPQAHPASYYQKVNVMESMPSKPPPNKVVRQKSAPDLENKQATHFTQGHVYQKLVRLCGLFLDPYLSLV